jgi:hypothetical protein
MFEQIYEDIDPSLVDWTSADVPERENLKK